jgi:hypothetical protein
MELIPNHLLQSLDEPRQRAPVTRRNGDSLV